MKRLIITTLAATLLAGTALSGTAMAAGQRYDDHDRGRYDQRHDSRDNKQLNRQGNLNISQSAKSSERIGGGFICAEVVRAH